MPFWDVRDACISCFSSSILPSTCASRAWTDLSTSNISSAVTSAIMDTLGLHLDCIILDHGVREQPVGGVLQRRLGLRAIGARKLDIEHLALTHARDAIDTERFQRAFDGLALRIENAGFQRDGDACLHFYSLSSFPQFLASVPCLSSLPQLLTRTGPEPAGRSFSIRMPRRL